MSSGHDAHGHGHGDGHGHGHGHGGGAAHEIPATFGVFAAGAVALVGLVLQGALGSSKQDTGGESHAPVAVHVEPWPAGLAGTPDLALVNAKVVAPGRPA